MSVQCIDDVVDIAGVVDGRARLSAEQALWLYRHVSLHDLGQWAAAVTDRLHGDRVRTYVIDRNINYTNVCSARCTFCAFRRDGDEDDAYVLSRAELHEKIRELADIGGTQILMQGGMHPELPLSFYEEMLRGIKTEFGHIHVHGFSPPELVEFVAVCEVEGFPTPGARRSDELPHDVWLAKLEAIVQRLQQAGLDSVPGGGAEIFVEHVRRRIGSTKATGTQWLDVMRTAHRLGMFTSATMMFGHIEGVADRIMHMDRVRTAQDEAIAGAWPGRYVSFIAWPFQPEHTPLGRLPQWDRATDEPFPGDVLAEAVMRGEVDEHDKAAAVSAAPEAGKVMRLAGATDYVRMQALARLYLDNIPSIGSSWVTMGPKIGQLGLMFGANDMGSVMMEENVVSAAGTTYRLNEAMICRLIRDAGYTPAQRDNAYRHVKVHDGNAAPDLVVTDWSEYRPDDSAFEQPAAGAGGPVPLGAGDVTP